MVRRGSPQAVRPDSPQPIRQFSVQVARGGTAPVYDSSAPPSPEILIGNPKRTYQTAILIIKQTFSG